ncbi:aminoglycoside phosphotransferase family protein [Deinococcus aetherius]|uniref:aminoglycoside phosphotransferase family protein n=1 Tax=Deinococcus aetherius TaxID=200252 RepID=UPI0022311881|nr:aminoglycoside phosphotransferase family protein [Deinococcus aetherius]
MEEAPAVTVQPTVRAYAESLGAHGRLWLDSLPALLGRQCREWELGLGNTLPGGSRSYVRRVTTRDGRRAVLKLALPEPILTTQISTLVAARGHGYVQVLAHDLDRGALLLESLGPSAGEAVRDVPTVLALTAGTLRQAWRVPREVCLPPQGESGHKAAGLLALVRDLAEERGDPELQVVVYQALRYARERWEARDPARQVVVHGDPHAANLLRVEGARPGAETGYVFVDPEGFLCEPEYDLGVALRGWNTELLASSHPNSELRSWCEQMAWATGTDAEAIWQWAYLERVSSGLYLGHHGLPDLGAPFLTVAGRLLTSV